MKKKVAGAVVVYGSCLTEQLLEERVMQCDVKNSATLANFIVGIRN